MPEINRQVPPKRTVPTALAAPAGSLLADAVSVTTLVEQKVKVCIYGRNRSGKTTLAAEFVEQGPVLFISAEPDACGGATSISHKKGVSLQRVSHKLLGRDASGQWLDADDKRCVVRDRLKGSAKLGAIAAELQGTHPFATVVIDTATSLQDLMLVELMGWDKPPETMTIGMVGKENFQLRADRWRESMRPFLNLSNCHVVILCQEKDHNPPTDDFGGKRKILHTMQQGSFMAPALGATNAQWLQDACGYVLQIYEDELMQDIAIPQSDPAGKPLPPIIEKVGTGKRQRHLRLLYHPNFAAGGRWQFDPNTPEFVTASTPRELYLALTKYIPSIKK